MATELTNLESASSIPCWKKSTSSFINNVSSENSTKNGGGSGHLEGIREKRKRISYEKEYFMRMLRDIENQSPIKPVNHEIEQGSNENHGNKFTDYIEKDKARYGSYFRRRGLYLEKSEDMMGVVDRIIEDHTQPSTVITTTTKDAGRMINLLLNKTYPKSCQQMVQNKEKNKKSMIPTARRESGTNCQNRKYRNSWSAVQHKMSDVPR